MGPHDLEALATAQPAMVRFCRSENFTRNPGLTRVYVGVKSAPQLPETPSVFRFPRDLLSFT